MTGCALAAPIAASGPAGPEAVLPLAGEGLAVAYYPVAGRDAATLRREVERKGRLGEDGRRYDGYTDWRIDWGYQATPRPGACAVASLFVTPSGIVTLPRWQDAAAAKAPLRAKWARYLQSLARHEQGHYDHAVAAAAEMRRVLPPITAPDCDALQARVGAAATAIVERFRQRDRDYDAQTGHGATQGVEFPG